MNRLLIILLCLLSFEGKIYSCDAFFAHSYACAGDTVFFYAHDQFCVYTWDFGDTTSGIANVSHDTNSYHVYQFPGTYYVTLFVNIGAEWDYKTQIIEIGSDCHLSSFSYSCSGGMTVNFINESAWNYNSSTWIFGDSASASSDTSTATNATHSFTTPGIYTVTLIASDGVTTDTVSEIISVDSCLNVTFINNLRGDCFADSTIIYAQYSGNPISYAWDYGDTASGNDNFSSDSLGLHLYSSPGIYLVTLIAADNMHTDTFYTVQKIIDCNVWPGNTNDDGEVNMEDLFAIGIYYADSGFVRNNATNNWIGQSSAGWSPSNFQYMYLQDLVDKKHADCNGDGIISTLDLTAVNQNYLFTKHGYWENDLIQMMAADSAAPLLKVNTDSSWNGNSDVTLPIDLSAADSVRNIYGIAARIYYPVADIIPGSVNVSFNNGWIGEAGIDIIGLVKNNTAEGYVDFGIVRTDKRTISGNGTIAELSFTINHFTGSLSFNIDSQIRLITNGFGNQEIFLPVGGSNTQLDLSSNSVEDLKTNEIIIYPNPAQNILNISTVLNPMGEIVITDLTGRKIKEIRMKSEGKFSAMNCSDLQNGIYILTINTETEIFSQRIMISRD